MPSTVLIITACTRRHSTNFQPSKNSTAKQSMPRNRRFSNLGIGGFRARSTRVSQVKKSAMAAANNSNMDQNNAQYTIENFTTKQGRRRQMKKKSEIDENYPDYLMQAFLGSSLLAHSAEVRFHLEWFPMFVTPLLSSRRSWHTSNCRPIASPDVRPILARSAARDPIRI